jgi:hypothetical protein
MYNTGAGWVPSGSVLGSGATNAIAVWSDATTIGTSAGLPILLSSGNANTCVMISDSTFTNQSTVVLGRSNSTSDLCVTIGAEAESVGARSVAVGYQSNVGLSAVCVGASSNSLGVGSVAIGSSSAASGAGSVAIGSNTTSSGISAVALGSGAVTSADSQLALPTGFDKTNSSWVSADKYIDVNIGGTLYKLQLYT